MSKPNVTEMEQEIGSQVQLFVWRIPKKNHDAMVKFQKQFNDISDQTWCVTHGNF